MAVKFIPILFSTPMVQAVIENRKSQTRRTKKLEPVNKNPDNYILDGVQINGCWIFHNKKTREEFWVSSPYGQPGDVLWVRETIYQNGELGLEYVADNESIDEDIIPHDFNVRVDKNDNYKFCKIPSIYMEKWACRLFLRIKDIRLERLRDISVWAAESEGIEKRMAEGSEEFRDYVAKDQNTEMFGKWGSTYYSSSNLSFFSLWESINGKESLDINPWVWVIEFEKIEKPENFI